MRRLRLDTNHWPFSIAPPPALVHTVPLMKYLVAIICPPLAVLMCGRPMQALVNLALTLCLWVPGIIHALFIVNRAMADEKAGSTLHVMQLNSVLHKM